MFTYSWYQTGFIIGTKIFYGPQQQAHVNIKGATRGATTWISNFQIILLRHNPAIKKFHKDS